MKGTVAGLNRAATLCMISAFLTIMVLAAFPLVNTSAGYITITTTAQPSISGHEPAPYVALLVDSSVMNELSSELSRYVSDLQAEGMYAHVIPWNGSNQQVCPNCGEKNAIDAIQCHKCYFSLIPYNNTACTAVRALLQNEYSKGMAGALLVGDIPSARVRYLQTDVFYMDLNGNWTDINQDGFYEEHSGNRDPEVWVGRLRTSNASLLKNYFDKNHCFRTWDTRLPYRALIYLDDSWIPKADYLDKYIGALFSNRTVVTDEYTTNASDYLMRLHQGYYIVYVTVHSSETYQHFMVPGSPVLQPVGSSDIQSANTSVLFYLLDSCNIGASANPDYLVGSYIFSNNYTVAAIADSTVGVFFNQGYFFADLKDHNLGDTWKLWMNITVHIDGDPLSSYGWTLFGDPTLKLIDASAPTGSIAIDSDAAYTTSTAITLTLTYGDVGGSGVDKVRYSNDGSAWTDWQIASEANPWTLPSGDGSKTVYYQIRDAAGNTGIFSDSIILDNTAPTGSVAVNSGATYTTSMGVVLTISATDSNGVAEMSFSMDETTWNAWEAYDTSKSETLTGSDGTKTVYVKFMDTAGLESSVYEDSIILDTVAPVTNDDYDDLWHTSDFSVTLTASDATSGVSDIYYKTNDGATKTVSVDGQPQITTESATNSLEYWSVDGAGNEETHHTLTTIKLDKGIHDVSITNAVLSRTVAGQGYNLTINITAANHGTSDETFNVTLYANTTNAAGTQTVSNLVNGTSTVLTFRWDTSGLPKGSYIMSAYAWPVPNEMNTADNVLVSGAVHIVTAGDVNADGKVNIVDIAIIAKAFSSNMSSPRYDPDKDINYDGTIDIVDITIAAKNLTRSIGNLMDS